MIKYTKFLIPLFIGYSIVGLSQSDFQIKSWISDFNNLELHDKLHFHYDPNAYVDYGDSLVDFDGIQMQIEYLRKMTGKVNDVEILGETVGKSGNRMIIARLECEKGFFALMASLKRTPSGMLREYEIIRPYINHKIEHDFVEPQRSAWQKHSNAHDPSSLVSNVYSNNAYYLNQGNLIKGHLPIIEEYKYMSSTQWSITLTKQYLLSVNDKLAFEIGSYHSNGEGQYLLVWEKTSAKEPWRILLDSNF